MDNLTKAVYTAIQNDCKLTATGRLGYYLGSPASAPYNFVAEFPPENYTGTWITYRVSSIDRDLFAPGFSGDVLWQFVVWNQVAPISLPPIAKRLDEVLNEQKFATTTSAGDNFYCVEFGDTNFDEDRNSFFARLIFQSRVKLYTRGLG